MAGKKRNDLQQVMGIEAVAAQMESALQPLLAALAARDAQQAQQAKPKPAAKSEPVEARLERYRAATNTARDAHEFLLKRLGAAVLERVYERAGAASKQRTSARAAEVDRLAGKLGLSADLLDGLARELAPGEYEAVITDMHKARFWGTHMKS